VAFITGRSAAEWKPRQAAFAIPTLGGEGDFVAQCIALAVRQAAPPETTVGLGPQRPFGVLLAASHNRGRALAMFRRLKLRFPTLLKNENPMLAMKRNLSRGSRRMTLVMVGAGSLAEAQKLCSRYNQAGLPCIARKNR
jgi:SPOR domain